VSKELDFKYPQVETGVLGHNPNTWVSYVRSGHFPSETNKNMSSGEGQRTEVYFMAYACWKKRQSEYLSPFSLCRQ
jgi:hypothetical protein